MSSFAVLSSLTNVRTLKFKNLRCYETQNFDKWRKFSTVGILQASKFSTVLQQGPPSPLVILTNTWSCFDFEGVDNVFSNFHTDTLAIFTPAPASIAVIFYSCAVMRIIFQQNFLSHRYKRFGVFVCSWLFDLVSAHWNLWKCRLQC